MTTSRLARPTAGARRGAVSRGMLVAGAFCVLGVGLAITSAVAMRPEPRTRSLMGGPEPRPGANARPADERREVVADGGEESAAAARSAPPPAPPPNYTFPAVPDEEAIVQLSDSLQTRTATAARGVSEVAAIGASASDEAARDTRSLIEPMLLGAPGRLRDTLIALGARTGDNEEGLGAWERLADALKGASLDVDKLRIQPEDEANANRPGEGMRRAEAGDAAPTRGRATFMMQDDLFGSRADRMKDRRLLLTVPVLPAGADGPEDAVELRLTLAYDQPTRRWQPLGFGFSADDPETLRSLARSFSGR